MSVSFKSLPPAPTKGLSRGPGSNHAELEPQHVSQSLPCMTGRRLAVMSKQEAPVDSAAVGWGVGQRRFATCDTSASPSPPGPPPSLPLHPFVRPWHSAGAAVAGRGALGGGGAFPGRWDALAHSSETESGHACRFFLGAARRERAQQKPQGQGRLAGARERRITTGVAPSIAG